MADYRFESDLVDDFCESIDKYSPWPQAGVIREFDYQSGRTDIVLSKDGKVVAIEAKLHQWKTALHQAYRNTCFADLSFVLLPNKAAMRALAFQPEFERRRIGLISIDPSHQFRILIDAAPHPPVLKWLKKRAASLAKV